MLIPTSLAAAHGLRPSRHINLLRGWPAPSLLPSRQIAESTARALSEPEISVPALEYGPDLGFEPLRRSLASWLAAHYRVHPADEERICVSGGASQSIACILQCFSDPDVTVAVWLVAPVYYLVCPIFEDAGFAGRLRAVPEDEEGVDVGWLRKKLEEIGDPGDGGDGAIRPQRFKPNDPLRKLYRHIIYCVPSSSNPSGKSMSTRRRQDLVHLARRHDALVVCDDVYDMLQWEVQPPEGSLKGETPFPESCRLPRLVDIDLSLGPPPGSGTPSEPTSDPKQQQASPPWFGNAISNGSFSKLISPGMRTGWVEGTPSFVLGLSRAGSTRSGGAPSQLCAAIIHDMLSKGVLDVLVSTVVRPALQRKHSVLLASLGQSSSTTQWSPGEGQAEEAVAWKIVAGERGTTPKTYGGYFLWLALPEGISATAVEQMARDEQNLTVSPGNMFRVLGDESATSFDGYLRLCFAWEDEDGIREGVERLRQAVLKLVGENKDCAKS